MHGLSVCELIYECRKVTSWRTQQHCRRFVCTHRAASLLYVKWSHGRHLEIMTSNRTSNYINQRVFNVKNIPANFVTISSETTEP